MTGCVIAAALTVAAVAVGVLAGGTSVGEVVACLFLVALLIDPVQTMVETIDEAQSAMAGLRRVLHVLDQARVDGAREGRTLRAGPLDIEVRDLHHAYGDGPEVLRGVSVVVPARTQVAVVGETGSGKTTLVRLLGRLLEPEGGAVLLGGVPVDEVDIDHLRARVTHVPQEVFLFDTTLADNLGTGWQVLPPRRRQRTRPTSQGAQEVRQLTHHHQREPGPPRTGWVRRVVPA